MESRDSCSVRRASRSLGFMAAIRLTASFRTSGLNGFVT
jgi:hypothetical protein